MFVPLLAVTLDWSDFLEAGHQLGFAGAVILALALVSLHLDWWAPRATLKLHEEIEADLKARVSALTVERDIERQRGDRLADELIRSTHTVDAAVSVAAARR